MENTINFFLKINIFIIFVKINISIIYLLHNEKYYNENLF